MLKYKKQDISTSMQSTVINFPGQLCERLCFSLLFKQPLKQPVR